MPKWSLGENLKEISDKEKFLWQVNEIAQLQRRGRQGGDVSPNDSCFGAPSRERRSRCPLQRVLGAQLFEPKRVVISNQFATLMETNLGEWTIHGGGGAFVSPIIEIKVSFSALLIRQT